MARKRAMAWQAPRRATLTPPFLIVVEPEGRGEKAARRPAKSLRVRPARICALFVAGSAFSRRAELLRQLGLALKPKEQKTDNDDHYWRKTMKVGVRHSALKYAQKTPSLVGRGALTALKGTGKFLASRKGRVAQNMAVAGLAFAAGVIVGKTYTFFQGGIHPHLWVSNHLPNIGNALGGGALGFCFGGFVGVAVGLCTMDEGDALLFSVLGGAVGAYLGFQYVP